MAYGNQGKMKKKKNILRHSVNFGLFSMFILAARHINTTVRSAYTVFAMHVI